MKMVTVKFKDGSKEVFTNVLNVGYHLDAKQVTIERLGEPTIVYCCEQKDSNNEDIIFYGAYEKIAIVIVS